MFVSLFVILRLLYNLTLFLFNVGSVNSNLRDLSNNGLRGALRGVAGDAVGKFVLNTTIATIVRSSSTAAIVIINFMGSKVVGLHRTVNVVVNTGINAAVAS